MDGLDNFVWTTPGMELEARAEQLPNKIEHAKHTHRVKIRDGFTLPVLSSTLPHHPRLSVHTDSH